MHWIGVLSDNQLGYLRIDNLVENYRLSYKGDRHNDKCL